MLIVFVFVVLSCKCPSKYDVYTELEGSRTAVWGQSNSGGVGQSVSRVTRWWQTERHTNTEDESIPSSAF